MSLSKVCHCNQQLLSELLTTLEALPDQDYQRPVTQLAPNTASPVGDHVRHITEFYQAFFRGLQQGSVDYDNRPRNPLFETHRTQAIQELRNIQRQLIEVEDQYGLENEGQKRLSLSAKVNINGESITTPSGIIRELLFLQSHSIHHMALVGVLLNLLGQNPPEAFGLATSTRIYRSKTHSEEKQGTS